jgi:hypothetical protein
MKCEECGYQNTEISAACEVCKHPLPEVTPVSEVSDTLDELVRQASVPNLASLFGQAKKQGIIKAAYSYGGPVSSTP